MIRLRVTEGPNTPDKIAFCASHSFLVKIQTNAGYIHPLVARSVECGVRSLENEECGEKEKEQNEIKTKVGFNNQCFFV